MARLPKARKPWQTFQRAQESGLPQSGASQVASPRKVLAQAKIPSKHKESNSEPTFSQPVQLVLPIRATSFPGSLSLSNS